MKWAIYIFLLMVMSVQFGTSGEIELSNKEFTQCFANDTNIALIKESLKVNVNSKFKKYDEYKKILSNVDPDELIQRLAYAEVLAANCNHDEDEVINQVIGVINNRVLLREQKIHNLKKAIESVVFDYNQFSSSLNVYSGSKYNDFLCPKNQILWKKIHKLKETSSVNLPIKAVHYYLYLHSPRWPKEPLSWKKFSETEYSKKSQVRDCIRSFINSQWK